MNETLKAANEALLSIMSNEKMADSIPSVIRSKIDRWYRLHSSPKITDPIPDYLGGVKTLKTNLWCLTVKDQDGDVEVFHIESDKKPTLRKAVIWAYGFDNDDEAIKIVLEDLNPKLEKVKLVKKF